jgi:hypothetical protein
MRWSFSMTQSTPHNFPALPAFPNWRFHVKHSNSDAGEAIAFSKLAPIMAPKSELIHQRKVTRVVKGAIAGGFHITTVKVDKDGAIVLYSKTQEREECEEPRLPLKANEWDEVLK